ncbi:hypothetical protein IVA78_02965 [Bradyrhizobium sp. 137]|uniref:hypothetical protein n=1 Tax=Bradyrhizobium sp. 137 TaxID=2782614 RepID=UPI001FFB4B96|nr:hypothetical protein [Bradyrhizobium sp. 137]MCK1754195.1 hypothetical protein [Bradyrhizobium sp. 137]
MKYFYVVWILIRLHKSRRTAGAPIKATFERRKSECLDAPRCPGPRLPPRTPAKDQWAAFTTVAVDPGPLGDVANTFAEFLTPQTKAHALKDGAAA